MDRSNENRTLTQDDFTSNKLSEVEFINCVIKNCNLFEFQITNCYFANCSFINCDLSMSKLSNTQLDDVNFKDCKILGVDFSRCTGLLFKVNFNDSIADFCSFEKLKMDTTIFLDTSLKGVDFSETSLQKAKFENTDLQDAIFFRTNLKEADLSSAYNLTISPNQNNLKKAIVSQVNMNGLLREFDLVIV